MIKKQIQNKIFSKIIINNYKLYKNENEKMVNRRN